MNPVSPFTHSVNPTPLGSEELNEIDTILDELRIRFDETPQWEFCEGFMAALICCRRVIPPSEYLSVLLDIDQEDWLGEGSFADAAQAARFTELWLQRWYEVEQALDAKVESLDDEAAYMPALLDVRGAVAALPEEEPAALPMEVLPSFGQVWALGFMYAVEAWPEEWQAPRDKEAARWLDEALDALVALTEDDTDPATLSPLEPDGLPSTSIKRLDDFAAAVWAVYDLRDLWRTLGPRVEPLFRAPTPGRNEPCSCGSGKKYKKCCGS